MRRYGSAHSSWHDKGERHLLDFKYVGLSREVLDNAIKYTSESGKVHMAPGDDERIVNMAIEDSLVEERAALMKDIYTSAVEHGRFKYCTLDAWVSFTWRKEVYLVRGFFC